MPRHGRYREPSPYPASEPGSPNTRYGDDADYTPPRRPFGRNRAIAYSDDDEEEVDVRFQRPAYAASKQSTGRPPADPYNRSNSQAPSNVRNQYSGPSDSKAHGPKWAPAPPNISGRRGAQNVSDDDNEEEDWRYQPKQHRGPSKIRAYNDDDDEDDDDNDDNDDDDDHSFRSVHRSPPGSVYDSNQFKNPPQQVHYNQYRPRSPVRIQAEYSGPSNRRAGRGHMDEQPRPLPRFSERRWPRYDEGRDIEEDDYPRSRQKQPDRGHGNKYYNDEHDNEDRNGCDEMANILDQLTLSPGGSNVTLRKPNHRDDDDDDDAFSSSSRHGPAKIVVIKDMHLHMQGNKIENFTWAKKEKGKGKH